MEPNQEMQNPLPPSTAVTPLVCSPVDPGVEDLIQAIKRGCEELADESNYHLPAWWPGSIAAKLASYASTALMRFRENNTAAVLADLELTAKTYEDKKETAESDGLRSFWSGAASATRDAISLVQGCQANAGVLAQPTKTFTNENDV